MSLLFGTICAQREVFRLTTADDNNKALVLAGIKGGHHSAMTIGNTNFKRRRRDQWQRQDRRTWDVMWRIGDCPM